MGWSKMKFNELEKNMFVCAILTVLTGIGLFLLDKSGWAIASIASAVAFAGIGIGLYITRKKKDGDSNE